MIRHYEKCQKKGLSMRLSAIRSAIKRAASFFGRFLIFRVLYPLWYRLHALRPMQAKKVLFVEVRRETLSNSFALLYDAFCALPGFDASVFYLRIDTPRAFDRLRRGLTLVAIAARTRYIFLNEACKEVNLLPLRRGTRLVQVFHACGAFKHFGRSTADTLFGDSGRMMDYFPGYNRASLVTVSSPEVIWAYAEAMDMQAIPERIVATGVSRTDVFFDAAFVAAAVDRVRRQAPQAGGKKILLYAPTFRGDVKRCTAPDALDIEAMARALSSEYVLLVKQHPLVRQRPPIPAAASGFAVDVSDLCAIDDLLCAADLCITDYSSLIFEYSLFERPMIFFAYDMETYVQWRDFYYPLPEIAPGPILSTTQAVIDAIERAGAWFDAAQLRAFRQRFMSACDGQATGRIVSLVLGGEEAS